MARIERTLGAPLQRAVDSREGAAVVSAASRAMRTGMRMGERARRQAVHAMYLPTRRDVDRLRGDVARLHRTVEELGARLEDQEHVRR